MGSCVWGQLGALRGAFKPVLGGSWVVSLGVMSGVATILTHTRGLGTRLIATHDPHSRSFADTVWA